MSDADPTGEDQPPPILGRWRNLYMLEVVVLALLVLVFALVGAAYS